MSSFAEEDRRIFQTLIDHHLDPLETMTQALKLGSVENARYYINTFCEKYHCVTRTEILAFERMGLHPFFQLSATPLNSEFCLRQFKLVASHTEYLSLCVTPHVGRMPLPSKDIFPVTKIYRPTNNISLLHSEARRLSFNDEWLLNLKEVMVEQGMGDVIYHQEVPDSTPLTLTQIFLEQVKRAYLNDTPKLIDYRLRNFLNAERGLLASYLDISIPSMVDYLLILEEVQDPLLFVGGFLGRFPLTELYEASNTLIARIRTPELNYAKFALNLYTHLISVCKPSLWLISEEVRQFDLIQYWDGHWRK